MSGLVLERLEGSTLCRHGLFRAWQEEDLAAIQAGIRYLNSTSDMGIKAIPGDEEARYTVTLI